MKIKKLRCSAYDLRTCAAEEQGLGGARRLHRRRELHVLDLDSAEGQWGNHFYENVYFVVWKDAFYRGDSGVCQ